MTARNHHYVPQFYFRNFSPGGPEGGDVRLINLARRKYIATTSIKGQCYRVGFHDYKPGLESALGKLEALAAPAIRGIISSGVPPEPRSQDHQALAAFTAIQRSRTHTAAVTSDKMADRMFKIAYEDEAKRRGIDVSNYEIKSPFPVALPLGVAAKCSPLAMRLGVHVFVNETSEEFITSDNPVVAMRFRSWSRARTFTSVMPRWAVGCSPRSSNSPVNVESSATLRFSPKPSPKAMGRANSFTNTNA